MKKYAGIKLVGNESKTYLTSNALANNIVINSARNSVKAEVRNAADLKTQNYDFQRG